MNNIDKTTAINNILSIVNDMGFNSLNYIFLNNKFITQQMLIYDQDRIVTLFVKLNKKTNKIKRVSNKVVESLAGNKEFLLSFIASRIKSEEFSIKCLEDIALVDNDTQLYFIDDYGAHFFKIARYDIYGFDQNEQLLRLKKFVENVYRDIKRKE